MYRFKKFKFVQEIHFFSLSAQLSFIETNEVQMFRRWSETIPRREHVEIAQKSAVRLWSLYTQL